MANTKKQNFRCGEEVWNAFGLKVAAMQAAGYRVDMSSVLRAEVERVTDETVEGTAKRLGLTKADA